MMTMPDRIWANAVVEADFEPVAGEWNHCDVGSSDDTEYTRTDVARADTEAAVRRALEAAAKAVEELGYFGPSESGFTIATEIRALAADPVALAKIVEGRK